MYTIMASSKSSIVMFICLILSNAVLEAEAKGFFVFGDSLVEGEITTTWLPLHEPIHLLMGLTIPLSMYGRVTNGYNLPDLISQAIGEEATMSYLSPNLKGEKLLVGATFASAGVGILDDNGALFGNLIMIKLQMQYFEQYQRVSDIIAPKETKRLVNQAVTLITLEGNDFVNNYYLVPFSPRSRHFSLPDYVFYVISEYRKVLRRLYQLGLRRIMVSGTGPIGCAPAELAQRSPDGNCALELQRAANLFNPQLQALLDSVNSEIGGNIFIGVNIRQTNFTLFLTLKDTSNSSFKTNV